jgi:hypothetical protein
VQAAVVASRRASWMTMYARQGRPSRPVGGGSATARSRQRLAQLQGTTPRTSSVTRSARAKSRQRGGCLADHSIVASRTRLSRPYWPLLECGFRADSRLRQGRRGATVAERNPPLCGLATQWQPLSGGGPPWGCSTRSG